MSFPHPIHIMETVQVPYALQDVIIREEKITINELNYKWKIFKENGIIGERQ